MAIEVSRMNKTDISAADIRQSREGSHWSPLGEGNRMVYVPKRPHGYRRQQEEKVKYLTGHWPMSARVWQGLIEIR